MAEVTAFRNNALPYPIYGFPWVVVFPILDNTGALVTGAAGLDSERSLNGDTFADCTNEATEIATSSGMYYLVLTAAEMSAEIVSVITKTSTTDAKTTPIALYPRHLVVVREGTPQGGTSGTITFDSGASSLDDAYVGMLAVGSFDSNPFEARVIQDYNGSTKVASVSPDWNTTPDSDDSFAILRPDGVLIQQANTTAWNGTQVATPTVAGVPEVDVTHINGGATNGNNATLSLRQLDIVNSSGSAVIASSTGSNGAGIQASGHGTGSGLLAFGGATGDGFTALGGVTSGDGFVAQATTSGHGISAIGVGVGTGMNAQGGDLNAGIQAIGGATSGAGIYAEAGAASFNGMHLVGNGSGAGLQTTGGTTGNGLDAMGGLTSGDGFHCTSPTAGDGFRAASNTDGMGIHAIGGDTSGDGMKVEAPIDLDINAPNSDIGVATAVENADALLARNIAGGSSAGRIVSQALYALRNKWTNAAGTYTVYETDDTTPSWTAANTSDAAAEPITGSDPS